MPIIQNSDDQELHKSLEDKNQQRLEKSVKALPRGACFLRKTYTHRYHHLSSCLTPLWNPTHPSQEKPKTLGKPTPYIEELN